MKKDVFLIILLFIMIALLGVGGFLFVSYKNETDKKILDLENKIDEISSTGNISAEQKPNQTPSKTKTDIVRELYLEHLKNIYKVETKIDEITFQEKNDTINDFYSSATEEAIFAYVKYSVHDVGPEASAGNGKIDGEWVIEKLACVYIDKVNGEYKLMSQGTG